MRRPGIEAERGQALRINEASLRMSKASLRMRKASLKILKYCDGFAKYGTFVAIVSKHLKGRFKEACPSVRR